MLVDLVTDGGETVTLDNEMIASGAMKDIYVGADRSFVVGFFRDLPDDALRERLREITTRYRTNLFDGPGGTFWRSHFCWPTDTVEHEGRIGVVVPFYRPQFFFEHGSVDGDRLGIRGKDKEGKWFASASNRAKFLDPRERGDWLAYLRICLGLARAVRRLHMAGLAHSDLSYKNVLVDPVTGGVCLIDLDGLVVPGKFPPDVVGTPDFIAPEVVATQHLPKDDPARRLPSRLTDRHALAVLIYVYLFYRHPLRGRKLHDPDPTRDDLLSMGSQALFVEHPNDASNRVDPESQRPEGLPWTDPKRTPFTLAGPYLSALFLQAFVEGLHDPDRRPSAADWESALIRTLDMIQPCSAGCETGWFVFDETTKPTCPHCGTPYRGVLPVLDFYSSRDGSAFRPDDHRLMVWSGQSLSAWHENRNVVPNEHLPADKARRVGYFQLHGGTWHLVNENMPTLHDLDTNKTVPVGEHIALKDGGRILLSDQEGGRLAYIRLSGSAKSLYN